MENYILDASFNALDGSRIAGPVTFDAENVYLFRNRFSDLDLYFYLKKSNDGWQFAGGPDLQIPQTFIDEVGSQIDSHFNY